MTLCASAAFRDLKSCPKLGPLSSAMGVVCRACSSCSSHTPEICGFSIPGASHSANLPAGLGLENPLVSPGSGRAGVRFRNETSAGSACVLGDFCIFLCTECLCEQEKLVAMFLALIFSKSTRKSLLLKLYVSYLTAARARPGSSVRSPEVPCPGLWSQGFSLTMAFLGGTVQYGW